MDSNKETELKDSWKNVPYVFGFAEECGIAYGYHMSDSLQDPVTWESVEFKFSMPNSQYLLVWRRDNKKITDEESQMLVDYVKENMEDFTSQGEQSGPRTQTKILHMLLPSREYLVMSYGELVLPGEYEDWEDFASSVFREVWDCQRMQSNREAGIMKKLKRFWTATHYLIQKKTDNCMSSCWKDKQDCTKFSTMPVVTWSCRMC